MEIQTIAKYVFIGTALAVAGFIGAIGVLTIVFAPNAGAYAPVTSSDAAAWLQAIGSIGAILGAFLLGAKQAKDARTLALELESKRRRDQVERYGSTVRVLRLAVVRTIELIAKKECDDFRHDWKRFIHSDLKTALAAFDAMPAHEIGTDSQISHAFAVRTAAQSLIDAILAVLRARGLVPTQYHHLKATQLSAYQIEIDNAYKGFEAAWNEVK